MNNIKANIAAKATALFAAFLLALSILMPQIAHGATTGPGAPIDTTSGVVLPTFSMIDNGAVNAVISDGANGWYVGGTFTSVAGNSAFNRLIHVNSDGSLDTSWNPAPNNTVHSLFLSGGTLYVGGDFTTLGGTGKNRLGAITTSAPATTLAFTPNVNGSVRTILVSGSTVYAGGLFTLANGSTTRRGLAAFAASTGTLTSWNPNPMNSSNPGQVYSFFLDGTNLYVGGTFTNIATQNRVNFAILNITTGNISLACNLSTGNDKAVRSIIKDGNTIYLAGNFNTPRSGLFAMDLSANCNVTNWDPGLVFNDTVNAMQLDGTNLYVGGSFTSIGGQSRNRVAKLDTTINTGSATSWNPNSDNTVNALALNTTKQAVYVGGTFSSIGATAPDTTLPDTTITSVEDGSANSISNGSTVASASATFSFSGTDNIAVAGFECSLDGGVFSTCSSPHTVSGLSNANHTFQVRAVDTSSNVDGTPATFSWTVAVDTTAPDTVIDSSPSIISNQSSADFTFHSTETGSTFACSLDGGSFITCSSPKSYLSLADGSHTFAVRATDSAGNTDATPAEFLWTIATDTTAPETTIDTTPASITNLDSASFTFHASEVATFECQLDGSAFTLCSSPASYTSLNDGSHSFAVRATDSAGNTDATPASFSWVVDSTAPDTVLDTTPASATSSNNADFTFHATEDSTFECSLDNAAFVACSSPTQFSSLGEGDHTFNVRAIDAAGNTDATPATFSWSVDSSAPDTVVDTAPEATTNQTSANFTFHATEAATFECSVDSGSFATCVSPFTATGLSDGSHTFNVRAVDVVGNTDATPASVSWIIDSTAPDTNITSTPNANSNTTTATFEFVSTETGSTFECQIDGGSFSVCVSPQVYSSLADGTHTFSVRATDAAGNTDATPATFSWSIDSTAPDTILDTTPNISTNETLANFTFHSTESNSTFSCQLDTEPVAVCSSPLQYSNLADGSHTLTVQATDNAGNTDPTPATFAWSIDATAPTGTVVINNDALITNNTLVDLAITCTDLGTGCSEMQIVLDGTADTETFEAFVANKQVTLPAGDGNKTVIVVFRDAAGNLSNPATDSINLDTTAPQTTIDSHPTDPTTNTTADFSFSASEADVVFECQLDGDSFEVCSGIKTYTGLSDGSHSFAVRGTDAAGNTDNTPATFTWNIDTTAPTISNVQVTPTLVGGTSRITITKTVSDSTGVASVTASVRGPGALGIIGSVNLSLQSGNSQSGIWNATYDYPTESSAAPDGTYTIEDTATDTLGNQVTEVDGTVTLDRTAAAVTIVSIIPNVTKSSNTVVVTVTATDATSGISGQSGVTAKDSTINIDAVLSSFSGSTLPGQIGTWVFNQAAGGPVIEGIHTETVNATDAAGNVATVTGTYRVDNTPPDTIIDTTPNANSSSTSANFSFHSTEANSTFECKIDSGVFESCVSPTSYSSLPDGSHTFSVKSTDEAGNTDAAPAQFSWTIDSTAPTGSIVINGGSAGTNSADVTLTLTCVDSSSGCSQMKIAVDGVIDTESFEPFSATKNVTLPSPDGNKTVVVVFRDAIGNISDSANDSIILDRAAPDTIIDTTPSASTTNTTAAFTFHSTEPASTFMCKLDSASFVACSSPVNYSSLSVGTHTFSVKATDSVGNIDATPATFTWNITQPVTDTDGDGIPNNQDNCPTIKGPASTNGCPVADRIVGVLHIIDQTKTHPCGVLPNGKPDYNCDIALVGGVVRIYDRESPAFISRYGTKRPKKDLADDIFNSTYGRIAECTTASDGKCLVGEDHPGKFMVIIKLQDGSNAVYDSKFKNFKKKGFDQYMEEDDDDDDDDCAPGTFRVQIIQKKLTITKVYKKNGTIDYRGGRVTEED